MERKNELSDIGDVEKDSCVSFSNGRDENIVSKRKECYNKMFD